MNPLESRLPLAPNLRIFCFYGVGKSTERSYFYREDQDPNSSLNVTMDTSLMTGAVDHGVIPGEGDGTYVMFSVESFPYPDLVLNLETYLRSFHSFDVSRSSLVLPKRGTLTLK